MSSQLSLFTDYPFYYDIIFENKIVRLVVHESVVRAYWGRKNENGKYLPISGCRLETYRNKPVGYIEDIIRRGD